MNKQSTIYKVLLLGVLCAFCGLLLSGVNGLTAPIIEEAAIQKEKANLVLIYPDAEFKEVKDYDDPTGLITGIYTAEGLGTVYKIHNVGYNSNGFTFLLAFNNDGTVGGFQVLEHGETDGFGSRCFDEEYVSSVESLTTSDSAPLLSGATLTSTAIKQGYDAAKALFTAK
ncbi:MAG: FMN-binding protein [Solobacterium sp.]|nr:FMN-binding protein [Solobacterium sp.]